MTVAHIGQDHVPPPDSLTEDELESKVYKSFNSKTGFKFFSGVCEPDQWPAEQIEFLNLVTYPVK